MQTVLACRGALVGALLVSSAILARRPDPTLPGVTRPPAISAPSAVTNTQVRPRFAPACSAVYRASNCLHPRTVWKA